MRSLKLAVIGIATVSSYGCGSSSDDPEKTPTVPVESECYIEDDRLQALCDAAEQTAKGLTLDNETHRLSAYTSGDIKQSTGSVSAYAEPLGPPTLYHVGWSANQFGETTVTVLATEAAELWNAWECQYAVAACRLETEFGPARIRENNIELALSEDLANAFDDRTLSATLFVGENETDAGTHQIELPASASNLVKAIHTGTAHGQWYPASVREQLDLYGYPGNSNDLVLDNRVIEFGLSEDPNGNVLRLEFTSLHDGRKLYTGGGTGVAQSVVGLNGVTGGWYPCDNYSDCGKYVNPTSADIPHIRYLMSLSGTVSVASSKEIQERLRLEAWLNEQNQ